jgi:glyoxylase-like metal-dependent hydrolase (beta-lactamase superfamily II)
MKIVSAILFGLLSIGQIQRPFTSDPSKVCQSCDSWNAPCDPVRLFGNTFYVGTARLSSVLITSPRGHILLDGGLPQSAELIDRHIRQLGFKTEDVRLIVNSHGHYDHAGGIHALQHASGATSRRASRGPTRSSVARTPSTTRSGFGHESMHFRSIRRPRRQGR